MDFLRHPSHGQSGAGWISGSQWKPAGDVVLGVDALTAQALAGSCPETHEEADRFPDDEIKVVGEARSAPQVEPATACHPPIPAPPAWASAPPTRVVEVHLATLLPALIAAMLVVLGIIALVMS